MEYEIPEIIENVSEIAEVIPFIKEPVKLAKACKNIRDRIFLKKIESLILGFNKMNDSKLDEYKLDFWDDKKLEKIGFTSITILEKYENTQKAELMGKLLYMLICKEISIEQYLRTCYIILNTFYEDILLVNRIPTDEELKESWETIDYISLKNLLDNDILEEVELGLYPGSTSRSKFYFSKLSEFGEIIKNIL